MCDVLPGISRVVAQGDAERVAVPCLGGFVCSSESSAEWIAVVSEVWRAYYAGHIGVGRGNDGLAVPCGKKYAGCVGAVHGVGCSCLCGCSRCLGDVGVSEVLQGGGAIGGGGAASVVCGKCKLVECVGSVRGGVGSATGAVSEGSCGAGGSAEASFAAASVNVGEGAAASVVDECVTRGKHYVQNRRKKERRAKLRKMENSWRVGASPSVCTVDTRTAEEIEAVRTLALRRSAENKVAEQIAKHRLTSLTDEKKTQAVRELQVQRMNANINAAKAKSQACYAKCDNSLKSLGSAGSAGEFAWKKTEADLAASREEVKNLRAQMDRALAVGGPEIFAAVAEVPEPKKYGIRDVLGEPGANWTEEEVEAYYDILNAEAIGNYSTNWEAQFPRSFWDRKAKENF